MSDENKSANQVVEDRWPKELPANYETVTHKFNIDGHTGHLSVGLFRDGNPGEIFLVMPKEGSTVGGLLESFTAAISIALQYGVPPKELAKKFIHTRFDPSGRTGEKEIPYVKSAVDYIFRWLAHRFLTEEDRKEIGIM